VAHISDTVNRHTARKAGQARTVTSVEVTITLTAGEARLLPPSSHIKPNFPGVSTVQSAVNQGGGELVLRYLTSDRPFNGATPEDIPEEALAAVNRWLTRIRREGS
jgi:hypothetical protein